MLFCSFIIQLLVLCSISLCINPGPQFQATRGSIWPKPQYQKTSTETKIVSKHTVKFKYLTYQCELLCDAVDRFKITFSKMFKRRHQLKRVRKTKGDVYLSTIAITLTKNCTFDEIPTFNVSEKYNLTLKNNSDTVYIESDSIWGILHGLQSLIQLFYYSKETNSTLINCTEIYDYPDFPHRGLLLDTSRHFIPIPLIKQTLEAMAINKFNVFHWHITDDQSFPYQSYHYPKLSKMAAYTSDMIYTKQGVKAVLKYAHERGIRVIVEFDTPGHTRSWGVAYPQLLSNCTVEKSFLYGPLNLAENFTYEFIKNLFTEVSGLFVDSFIHLGGDEVDSECWVQNKKIHDFIIANNITNPNAFHIEKVAEIVRKLQKKAIVWEEVFDEQYNFHENLTFHVWKPKSDILIDQIIKKGYSLLYSSCWYLDHLETGGDWKKFYNCLILKHSLSIVEQKLILGGEACMWTEVVDKSNLNTRIWPRAAAVAERLWNYRNSTDLSDAARRLEEHYCRLRELGIPAQPPNGPGYCEH